MKKIAIIYLLWADEPQRYLERALVAVAAQTYDHANLQLVVVYNPKEGAESSAPFIVNKLDEWKDKIPPATFLPQEKNLGFSGGNNAGIKWAIESSFDYVFLHNADGYLHPEAMEKMAEVMVSDDKIGAAQALVLLHPETELINSAGNSWHYLGIGYCELFREKFVDYIFPMKKTIGYASGAAVMMRCDLLLEHGLWSEDFFMYHEDTEYSLRLRMLGYKIMLASGAIFYHEYEFLKSTKKFYWMERNRNALQLIFYRWPTLVLLAPLELAYDLGLLFLSLKGGWWKEYWAARVYWLKFSSWRLWLVHRAQVQSGRKISDRELLHDAAITVPSANLVAPRLVVDVVNGVFSIYYYLLKLLVWW